MCRRSLISWPRPSSPELSPESSDAQRLFNANQPVTRDLELLHRKIAQSQGEIGLAGSATAPFPHQRLPVRGIEPLERHAGTKERRRLAAEPERTTQGQLDLRACCCYDIKLRIVQTDVGHGDALVKISDPQNRARQTSY